jgi:hypothetical protein
MKSLIGLGILLFFTGEASAAPPARLASAHIDSLALVQLVHLDELLSRTFNDRARESFAAGRLTQVELECVKTRPTDFTEGMAAAVRRELSTAEIASTNAYLRSKDGRIFGSAMFDPARTAGSPPELSSSEVAAFAAFRISPAGKKLFETSMLMTSAAMLEFVDAYGKQAKAKCHITRPPQQSEDAPRPLDKSDPSANSRSGSSP